MYNTNRCLDMKLPKRKSLSNLMRDDLGNDGERKGIAQALYRERDM